MFYKEEDIHFLLICPKCNKKFTDPRSIPCGETLCHSCIQNMFNSDKNGFNCDFCSSYHLQPDPSFPVNKKIQKLLSQKYTQVCQSQGSKDLKHTLELIKKFIQDLKACAQNSSNKIKEFCKSIHHDVESSTDGLINEIHKQRDCLLSSIDSYEIECLKSVQTDQYFIGKLNKIMDESTSFCEAWLSNLENFDNQNINDQQLKNASLKANEYLRVLNNEKNLLHEVQFNGKLMKFKKNNFDKIDPNLLGKIQFELISDLNLKLEKFHQYDLKYKLNSINKVYMENVFINRFENGDFLFSYPISTFSSKISIVRHGNIVKDYEIMQFNNRFKTAIFEDRIYVFFSLWHKLRSFDKNFNQINDVSVGGEITSMCVDQRFLYCLRNDNTVLKYDHRLGLIEKIVLGSKSKEAIFQIKVLGNRIYVFDFDQVVTVMDVGDGKEISRFQVCGKRFIFFNEKIVSLNQEKDELMFYDLNGDLLNKQNLSNVINAKNLILIESEGCDRISFFDFSSYILYASSS